MNDLGVAVDGEGRASSGPADAGRSSEIVAPGGEAVANEDDVSEWEGASD